MGQNIPPVNDRSLPFKAASLVRDTRYAKKFARITSGIFILLFLLLFMPWTQNIRSSGSVTTYLPQDRPQSLQSVIPGRIERWYIREGQFVHKGDTIVRISEIRENSSTRNCWNA